MALEAAETGLRPDREACAEVIRADIFVADGFAGISRDRRRFSSSALKKIIFKNH
jgi:hypothetical protein